MPDFPVITQTQPMPFDQVLNRLRDRNYVELDDIDDVTDLDRVWASFSGDPKRLDLGDLMAALAHAEAYGWPPEVTHKIRHHLGFRSKDRLQFKILQLSPTEQVAITIIVPDALLPNTPTLVFGSGFAHSSALYVPSMAKLAHELKGRVVLFDTPGNGSSQSNDTVGQKDFYTALKRVIESEIPDGGKYFAAGHSLGSNAVYQLFQDIHSGKTPVGRRELVRAMVVNPIPTRLQEASGAARMSRSFIWGQVGSALRHGLGAMKATTLDAFDNNAPDSSERNRHRALIAREEVPISASGMIAILANQDSHDPSNAVGQDPRIAVVISRDDQLMNWDADRFYNQRGYLVLPGNHGGGLVGDHNPSFISSALAMVLHHGAGDAIIPMLEKGGLYSQASGVLRMGLGGTVRAPSAQLIPEISVKRGLIPFGNVGLFVDAGMTVTAGRQFGRDSRWMATPMAQAAVGLEGFALPITAKAGIQGGVDFFKASENQLVGGLTASLGINLARVAEIEAQARFSLEGFQDVLAAVRLQLN